MLVFIDESGDPGMKTMKGSSPLFTVTLLVFEDHDEAQAADLRIQLLKRELGFKPHFEFHFTKLANQFREAFLRAVAPYDFYYFSIVINKDKLSGPGFQHADSFYKYACSLVFSNAKPRLNEAIVVIDGSGNRAFRQQLSTYLKKRINDPGSAAKLIRKIKIQDSRRNNLLQMADMICGAVARQYSGKADAMIYRSIVSHREINVQIWPK